MQPRARLRRGAGLLAALLLLAAPGPARAQGAETDPFMIAWDVLFLRPTAFAQLLTGCALFVPVYLLSLPSDSASAFADQLIYEPWRWTFERPLGTP